MTWEISLQIKILDSDEKKGNWIVNYTARCWGRAGAYFLVL